MFVYIYIVGIKLQDIAIICYNYIVLYIMLYYILCCLSQDITRLYTININKHRSISDISDECWNRGPNFECLQHLALLLCHQHCGIATWSEPRPQHFGIIGFSAKTMPTWCSCLRLFKAPTLQWQRVLTAKVVDAPVAKWTFVWHEL